VVYVGDDRDIASIVAEGLRHCFTGGFQARRSEIRLRETTRLVRPDRLWYCVSALIKRANYKNRYTSRITPYPLKGVNRLVQVSVRFRCNGLEFHTLASRRDAFSRRRV
jgi:hypothetical protein